MYLWKCWHDTRGLFLILATGAALVMPITAFVCMGSEFIHGFGSAVFQATFSLIGFCAALALGAQAASQSFAADFLQFLFTRRVRGVISYGPRGPWAAAKCCW